MPDASPIRYQVEGRVVVLTLDRPERRNAADRALVAALVAAIDRAEADETIQALILTGAGASFCAGWDLDDILAMGAIDEASLAAMFDANARALTRLRDAALPTIALANGPVAGFGMSLVANCDFAIAAADATFHLPEAAIGLVPAVVAQDMLRVLGPRAAFDWLALADRRDADAAYRAGLVRAVVPAPELTEAGRALAARLAGMPEGAVAETKTLLRRLDRAPPDERQALTVDGAVAALRSPAAQALIARMRTENKSK